MRIDLAGRTAVVTGSSQGIGLSIAIGLAGAGARVVLTGRSRERLDTAAGALRATEPAAELLTVACDLATEQGAAELLDAVPAADILVNNLGIFGSRPPLDITDDEWRTYFDTNVLSAVRLIRRYLPGMTGRGGAASRTSPATRPSSSPPR